MEKPKYIEKLYALIFLCLGSAFVIMGTVFCLLGLAFGIAQTVLRVISTAYDKLHNELLARGTQLNGTVEKISLQKYIQL